MIKIIKRLMLGLIFAIAYMLFGVFFILLGTPIYWVMTGKDIFENRPFMVEKYEYFLSYLETKMETKTNI